MSVGDDPAECPLCMEPLEIDDINFYPCTCGYQICRFCWHRIRTDENGLCPACRKNYPEDPAEFKPLTDDEVLNIKKERKQKECQRKQKAAENRKHLANVRVVQRNLVFVVGLSPRLAEPEVLKKHDYFGKFGKIHKVVINQSTSYAGSQGPSASAYVTYVRTEDALRAILAVNNVHVDGRTLKTSLGTTKYCSHFLRSSQCMKPDCMYLHDLGEEAASFTKEEMQMGKHQEYEQKLIEQFLNTQNSANNHISNNKTQSSNKKSSSPVAQQQQISEQPSPPLPDSGHTGSNKPPRLQASNQHSGDHLKAASTSEAWPSLQPGAGQGAGSKPELLTNGSRSSSTNSLNRTNTPPAANGACSKTVGNGRHRSTSENNQNADKGGSDADSSSDSPLSHTRGQHIGDSKPQTYPSKSIPPSIGMGGSPTNLTHTTPTEESSDPSQSLQGSTLPSMSLPSSQPFVMPIGASRRLTAFHQPNNSLSFFSNNILGSKPVLPIPQPQQTQTESFLPTEMSDSIPVASCEDWSAAFGFKQSDDDSYTHSGDNGVKHNEDDLEFDPAAESFKGLADLIEKENGRQWGHSQGLSNSLGHDQHGFASHMPQPLQGSAPSQHSLPPGFSLTHIQQHQQQQQLHQQFYRPEMSGSRMMNLMAYGARPRYPPAMHNNFHHAAPGMGSSGPLHHPSVSQSGQPSSQNDNFSVQGMQEQLRSMLPHVNISFGSSPQQLHSQHPPPPPGVSHPQSASGHSTEREPSWLANTDPAIVTTTATGEDAPHWLKSIHQLTESDGPAQSSRFPFAQQFQMGPSSGWPQMQNPPPGFRNAIRPNNGPTEAHKLAEALQ
ncbi:CCR4-NOT transcription complex subunit 4-like isoform X2 [Littorina saxatilis]|uniref:CCR4-NOT transcription complex subunit 4-like isoform X2 n=1 Tax=Littorina saxatilis TaxID=31220 RepID=UPI0038B60241